MSRVSRMSGSVYFSWTAVQHKDLLTVGDDTSWQQLLYCIICGRWSWPLIIHTVSHLSIGRYHPEHVRWSPSSLRWLCASHSYDCPLFFQVKKFAKYLDPNAHGRINFKDFCHGVFAIKGKRTVPLEQYFMPIYTIDESVLIRSKGF